ncbi:integrase [Bifidobacterium myosotis]|uniref:Integrase n=5 Tax=Bifidobacterium myosotis TaxID=1630166 RepID=A0A261FC36_9BIFI|nr:IS21 family transposase [Bifidobacterium myosotis]OZG56692.1 integrase [Bifidobacterium myosotis]
MAIPMPMVQDIRRLDRQGLSRAQIARRLHVDRGTVAKYADMRDCSPRPKTDRRYGSKIDPYTHLVDSWLEADRLMPRKQRHTIKRVHERLLAETDYDGEYSTTLRYVHRWREANRSGADQQGFIRLDWRAGSMQVDFGLARAVIAGGQTDVHCLVVSLPWSNMRLCVALPGENAECLCHGLMLVFEHIGGVPPLVVMDNATGAGHRNAKGEVTLTDVFAAFVAHHRIEVRFCNPYSGNEKGSVENAVGFLRRNIMVPPLHAESYEQLSRLMLERCDELAEVSYCPRLMDVPVTQVFAEEQASLMPLPSTVFDPVRWQTRMADKYGLVDIDSNQYLAGACHARSRVLAAIRWDTVTLTSPATGEFLAEYPRLYGKSNSVEDPVLVFPQLALKPRAWRESTIRPDIPDDIRGWLDSMDDKTLKESLKAIAYACQAAGFEPVMQACDEILACNRDMGLHADTLTPIALRMRDGDWQYPGAIDEPDLSGYDRFITSDRHTNNDQEGMQ